MGSDNPRLLQWRTRLHHVSLEWEKFDNRQAIMTPNQHPNVIPIGPAGFGSFAGLEAPTLVAGSDDVAVVGKAIE